MTRGNSACALQTPTRPAAGRRNALRLLRPTGAEQSRVRRLQCGPDWVARGHRLPLMSRLVAGRRSMHGRAFCKAMLDTRSVRHYLTKSDQVIQKQGAAGILGAQRCIQAKARLGRPDREATGSARSGQAAARRGLAVERISPAEGRSARTLFNHRVAQLAHHVWLG